MRPVRPAVVEKLFRFLRKNHRHNKKLQEAFLWQMLGSSRTPQAKALMLLERTVHTQSQPKLASLATFFRALEGAPETAGTPVLKTRLQRNALRSLEGFTRFVSAGCQVGKQAIEDELLFAGLRRQPGWGPKTAALLVRNLALVSRSAKLRQGFWPDIGEIANATIFLPVDAVILEVFAALKRHADMAGAGPLDTFERINRYLRQELRYPNRDMLCWDDLWFWGFVNQRSSAGSKRRKWEWNRDKYWSIPHTPKSPRSISAIERASQEFRQCLGVERASAAKQRPNRVRAAA